MKTNKPLKFHELEQLPPFASVGSQPARPVRQSFYVSGSFDYPPCVVTSTVKLPSNHAGVYRIDVEPQVIGDLKIGLPPMSFKGFHRGDFASNRKPGPNAPHRPEFMPMTHVPVRKPRTKIAPVPRLMLRGKPVRPLNVFPPDLRQQLFDQSYPWCTVGRTVSPNGDGNPKVGTGTLVGPRHMLTASHCIGWNDPGGPSVSFTPMYSSGAQPFGQAFGIHGYYYREIPSYPQDQLDVSEDYVVVVLDQRIGDSIGWMGTRTYSTDWDDAPYWFNIGYPVDLGGTQIPFWQNLVSFEDADNPGILGQEGDGLYMDTESASLAKGNSGGPFFAYWDASADLPGWHIVSVVSAEGTLDWTFDDDNWAAGGTPMVNLVSQALGEFP
jgi:V8-like Glu-specific endopeptidase